MEDTCLIGRSNLYTNIILYSLSSLMFHLITILFFKHCFLINSKIQSQVVKAFKLFILKFWLQFKYFLL